VVVSLQMTLSDPNQKLIQVRLHHWYVV